MSFGQKMFIETFQSEDEEVVAEIAEILNCIGTVLVNDWKDLMKEKGSETGQLEADRVRLFETKLPQIIFCFSHDSNEVSGIVTESIHQYLQLLKQLSEYTERRKQFVKQILCSLLKKYRFPAGYNHEHEGEVEAEFLEYRKEIKTIYTNIGLLVREKFKKSYLNSLKS